MNFERFVKCMMMTTSPNDGEALNALRMANAELATTGKNWSEVLRGKLQMPNAHKPAPRPPDFTSTASTQVERDFEDAFYGVDAKSNHYAFLRSLQSQFEQRGWLTGPQKAALREAAERNRKRSKATGWQTA